MASYSKKNIAIIFIASTLIMVVSSFNACFGPIKGGSDLQSLSICGTNPTHSQFHSGDGSAANPFVICSPEHLLNIVNTTTYNSSHFRLGQSIDLASISTQDSIGYYDRNNLPTAQPFTGVFDGGNFTIDNLNIVAPPGTTRATGLFAHTNGARISNLYITDANILGNTDAGILIGHAINTIVENVHVSGQVLPTSDADSVGRAGGLIGYIEANGGVSRVQNVTASALVRTLDSGSTLIGQVFTRQLNDQVFVKNCSSAGTVLGLGANTFGNIVAYSNILGDSSRLEIDDCHTVSQINVIGVQGSWIGLLTGTILVNGDNTVVSITNSSGQGSIMTPANFNVKGHVGGLIGHTVQSGTSSQILIDRTSADVDINITNPSPTDTNRSIAGLVGDVLIQSASSSSIFRISNSYSEGIITVNQVDGLGGIIGRVSVGLSPQLVEIVNSYSIVERVASVITNGHAIIGRSDGSGTAVYSNVYWNSNSFSTSDPLASLGITKLTNITVNQSASYANWDFTNIWAIQENFSPPYLR